VAGGGVATGVATTTGRDTVVAVAGTALVCVGSETTCAAVIIAGDDAIGAVKLPALEAGMIATACPTVLGIALATGTLPMEPPGIAVALATIGLVANAVELAHAIFLCKKRCARPSLHLSKTPRY